MRISLSIILVFLVLGPIQARAAVNSCLVTTALVEQQERLPRGLLYAIALTESGRWNAEARSSHAWPWTVRAAADAFVVDSKGEAKAVVNRLKQSGRKNIDVGCMQVNLKYHPDAFPDLDSAFEPFTNVRYAAQFLKELRQEARSWQQAIEWYHSRDRERGRDYRKKVYKHWQTAQIDINRAHRALAKAGNVLPIADAGSPTGRDAGGLGTDGSNENSKRGSASRGASLVRGDDGILIVRASSFAPDPISFESLGDRNAIITVHLDPETNTSPKARSPLLGIDIVRGSQGRTSFFSYLR